MGAFIGLLSFLLFIVVVLVILGLPGGLIYVVQQQTFVIIERLGKFNRITGPGLHVKIRISSAWRSASTCARTRCRSASTPRPRTTSP